MIYVDPLREWSSGWWCHCMTDNLTLEGLEDLHCFVERLGMKRRWFQNQVWYPHYDLRKTKRALAVRYGAIEVSSRELIWRCRWLTRTTDYAAVAQQVRARS